MMGKIVMPKPILCIDLFSWFHLHHSSSLLAHAQPTVQDTISLSISHPQWAGRNLTRHSHVQWLREIELLALAEEQGLRYPFLLSVEEHRDC